MTKLLTTILACVLVLIGCRESTPNDEPPAPVTFHVRPDGPLNTLADARDAVRALKQTSGWPEGGVTVYLHDGEYPITDSTVFEAQDSGTEHAPMVYQAYPDANCVFCGGTLLNAADWTLVDDPAVLNHLPESARGKVMRIDLQAYSFENLDPLPVTGMAAGGLHGNKIVPRRPAYYELFFNDRALEIARWPNTGYVTTGEIIDPGAAPRAWADDMVGRREYVPPDQRNPDHVPTFRYRDPRPARWTEAADPWLFMWNNFFADLTLPIRKIDTEAGTITLDYPTGYGLSSRYDRTDKKYYVFNLLEELDRPGEWYLDRRTGMLYLWPPGEIDGARIVLSRSQAPALVLDGVSHLTLRGITIEGLRSPTAIEITDGRGNDIDNCTIKNLAGSGVTVNGGAGHVVRNCHIFNTGTGGISLTGGDRRTLTPASHVAENNHVHDYARVKKSYSAAVGLNGVGNIARHNRIHGAEHYAIVFGGNDMAIEYNEIFDVVRTGTDMGAIYAGRDITCLGNVIRFNYFHHIGNDNPGHGTQAIFIDDGTSGVHIYGNVFYKAGTNAAVKFHGGVRNVVENNIFIGTPPSVAVHYSSWKDSWPAISRGNKTIVDLFNAVDCGNPPWSTRWPWLATALSDPAPRASNKAIGNVVVKMGLVSGSGWWSQEEGNFVTDTDPGFVDPDNGNFALRADAAVFETLANFKPIPFEKIGLYDYDTRARPVAD